MIRERAQLLDLAVGAAYVVAAAATVQIVDALVGQSPLAAAILGAVAAEIIAERAGVHWDPSPALSQRRIARTISIGLAAGLVAAIAIVAAGVALGWATIGKGAPNAGLGFAAARATALAMRDELILRAIPIATARRAGVKQWLSMGYSAIAGGAVLLLGDDVRPEAIALAVATGWAFAILLVRVNLFAAVAAHAAWILAVGPLLRGALLDVDWTAASFVVGARAAGRPAWLATSVVVVLAAAALLRSGPRPNKPAINAKRAGDGTTT